MTGVRFTASEWLRAVGWAALGIFACGVCWFLLLCALVLAGRVL